MWLVYAKKHSRLPSLTYNDAVEEALCFGWIDSKINPIDDAFYKQMFTPRKLKSAWSALNKTRVERLLAAGLMTPAGLALVKAARNSGAWDATKHVEELTIPLDLDKAIKANPEKAVDVLDASKFYRVDKDTLRAALPRQRLQVNLIGAGEAGMRTAIADMTTLGYIKSVPSNLIDFRFLKEALKT